MDLSVPTLICVCEKDSDREKDEEDSSVRTPLIFQERFYGVRQFEGQPSLATSERGRYLCKKQ
ncbi:hypothetical protein DFA_06346 [Cavenderia fasciculata]|uniref:Uncharacterized protein n=1 Tax=Cavenderia fasciculata TaxID=261658 RepID=F4PKS5_CACFS|nr:uncharacterized protein DFA_06346 [Cavenderia fasciculata]EGG24199.1 hypothetical protein DFA_06346 [Cavenderia fasciculata]|eukprot:XP_004362050.1 hypothetical protein DFA_06346 [Cavenderia fasciculata]